MDDTISRQAAIDTVYRMREIWDTGDVDDLEDMITIALSELCPAQPEIVRCKECCWRNDFGHWLGCPVLNVDDNNYCSEGKRRSDG